jgi:hypothetical protein
MVSERLHKNCLVEKWFNKRNKIIQEVFGAETGQKKMKQDGND